MKIQLKNIDSAAKAFLEENKEEKVFAFYGGMGAGKTTFIKALCKAMNVVDIVNSPTFTLINEYNTDKDEIIYHFDFYRIEKQDELFNLGCEDYFYSGNVCFIEWPEIAENFMPPKAANFEICVLEDESREIKRI